MKKKLVIIGIFLLIVFVMIIGCDSLKSNKDNLIGTWTYDYFGNNTGIIFYSNGTCIFPEYQQTHEKLTWIINDTKLVMTITDEDRSNSMVFDYSFSNDGKTLTMTDIEGTSLSLKKSYT